MGDFVARRVVIRVDTEGNADKNLDKTEKLTQKITNTAKKSAKEVKKTNQEHSSLLSVMGESVTSLLGQFPLVGKLTGSIFKGIDKMTKSLKNYNKETKNTNKTLKSAARHQQQIEKNNTTVSGNGVVANKEPQGQGGGSGGGMGGLLKGGLIGAAIVGMFKLAGSVLNTAEEATKIVTEENKSMDRLQFQLKGLWNIPASIENISQKWALSRTDLIETFSAGAKNLLSPSKMTNIIDKVIANAKALGTDSKTVMEAYGKSASTGSLDFLELNRSELVNNGYGKEVMQAQMKLQAYQQMISASGNNPLLQQKLMPQIEKINDRIAGLVGSKATNSAKVYVQERSDYSLANGKRYLANNASLTNAVTGQSAEKINTNLAAKYGNKSVTIVNNNGDKMKVVGGQAIITDYPPGL